MSFYLFKIPVNMKQYVNWVNNAYVCIRIYKLLKNALKIKLIDNDLISPFLIGFHFLN